MDKTTTQKASMHLHAAECESIPKSQLSVFGILKRLSFKDLGGVKLFFAMLFQFLLLQGAVAQTSQNITVKGTVLDESDNTGVPGVSITDNSKRVLGLTDGKGDFSINVAKGTTVSFTMIGYSAATRTFANAQTGVTVRLKSSTNELNTVVVTALGIKREERALGYATTTVDSSQITNAIASNWTDALSGKVAGLNLVRNSGPAASNKIILRGENNLTGDNEALIVIDGVVASSSSRRTAATYGGAYGTGGDIMPVDFGSGLADLNSEDIESVTVLKGPAASALYGQRGANGAVVITTKSATKNRKTIGITVTSNTVFEQVNRKPDRQFEFGQGANGANFYQWGTGAVSHAYGPPLGVGLEFYQYDPVTKTRGTTLTPWVAYEDPIDAFFTTGFEQSNAVTLDGTYKGIGMRLSASHGKNDWIVPNTGLERTSVTFNANKNITKKLNINIKAQYSNRHADNLPTTGFGNQSIMYWFAFAQPNINTDWYRDYWRNGRENLEFTDLTTSFPEGPYAISEQYINAQRRNGFLGNIQAVYKFNKEFSLMVRASGDLNKDNRETMRPYGANGTGWAQGAYRVNNIRSYEINADFMLKYEKKITKDFNLSATFGGSQMRNEYNRLEVRADGLKREPDVTTPTVYRLDNNLNPLVYIPDTSRYRINSFYATTSLAYKNYLYLDLTARQDWNSTLATVFRTDNAGFFYPSASLSFIASDYWKLPKAVNLAKFRASWAQVGSGSTTPYRTDYYYQIAGNNIYPGNVMTNPTVLPNPNLKPLITTTVELGLDLKMFKSRLNFDVAVYAGNTRNQILNRIIDRASGYNVAVFNVGRVDNKGIEIALNGTPVKTKDFTWTVNGTFSANRNKIKELADSAVVLRTGGFAAGGQVVATVGGSMGDLYGNGFLRSPDGQIVFDDVSGAPRVDDNVRYLGNTIPLFRYSFGTGFKYKQFSTNVLFDAQLGAVGHSMTIAQLVRFGKSTLTLPGRYNGILGEGVVENRDASGNYLGTYRKNDVIATNVQNYYETIGYNQAEGSIYSTDYVKFREANITYTFNKKFLQRIGFSKMTLSAYGRNLYIWSPWPAFDPEFGTLAGSDIQQGFEVGQLPSTRNFGLRLVVGI
ncbi:SusC/RagA family TonB-linked outer membrane protein [Pedobacter sp. SL55]|uniref:SusC/RagA family TonB-linked outer membrane protein n=1 Tax=Pedobacter sp. SL55 TaxID=2995161 RepID=UPI002270BDD9|nr:SusC/RagA family TonB-linked outer membrane protein [Pedobacter sp. SL55]WAC39612.1 SusC/RagA family TonB-linked outer membrane protein [Pedobacter sp. SL55]